MREFLVRFLYRLIANPVVMGTVERIWTIAEKQMLMRMLNDLQVTCLVDVGANAGQYARLIRRLGFTGTIVSFEPNPAVFRTLQQSRAGDPNWKGVNCGLGSEDGELEMNIFEESLISSFLPGKMVTSKIKEVRKVPVRRLDSVLQEILPGVAAERIYLKCDTQGFDLQVVKGAAGLMRQIVGLQSEIAVKTLYVGMPRYLESLAFYESLGLELMDLWLVGRTVTGEAMEYDCVMKRASE